MRQDLKIVHVEGRRLRPLEQMNLRAKLRSEGQCALLILLLGEHDAHGRR
jgi:hypothetical protein